jgi:hypothetical protein
MTYGTAVLALSKPRSESSNETEELIPRDRSS